MPGTWFLPPDFTLPKDGPIRPGMVIPHWSEPTTVLADLSRGSTDGITLPATTTVVESENAHVDSRLRTYGGGIMSKIEAIASLVLNASKEESVTVEYGMASHEIHQFSGPLMPEAIKAITNIPEVHSYMTSGLFLSRPVYIISGIRVATDSFTVTTERGAQSSFAVEASGPPATPLPVEVGGNVNHGRGRSQVTSYQTAPGIVFAYRMHLIKSAIPAEQRMFSHRSAFRAGDEDEEEEEEFAAVELTRDKIKEDMEVDIDFKSENCGEDGWYIYQGSSL